MADAGSASGGEELAFVRHPDIHSGFLRGKLLFLCLCEVGVRKGHSREVLCAFCGVSFCFLLRRHYDGELVLLLAICGLVLY